MSLKVGERYVFLLKCHLCRKELLKEKEDGFQKIALLRCSAELTLISADLFSKRIIFYCINSLLAIVILILQFYYEIFHYYLALQFLFSLDWYTLLSNII